MARSLNSCPAGQRRKNLNRPSPAGSDAVQRYRHRPGDRLGYRYWLILSCWLDNSRFVDGGLGDCARAIGPWFRPDLELLKFVQRTEFNRETSELPFGRLPQGWLFARKLRRDAYIPRRVGGLQDGRGAVHVNLDHRRHAHEPAHV